jgi:hypothetical protein
VVVDFSVGEVTLFLAARDEELQLGLTLVCDLSRCALRRFFDQGVRLVLCSSEFQFINDQSEAD